MWLDEYNRLMFKPINNDEETIQAVIIKNQNMPDIVYKYRTVTLNTIDALENGFLIASSLSCLNDPNEGRMLVDYENRWKIIYKEFLEILHKKTGVRLAVEINECEERDELFLRIMECLPIPKEHYTMWNQIWKSTDDLLKVKLLDFQNDLTKVNEDLYRICSFSEVHNSTLLWTHYADEFKGFCIGYNLKELNNDLTELLLPVRYSDTLIEADDTFFKGGGETNLSLLMNSLTLKSSDWQYEKEWRLLLLANNYEKMQKVHLPVPKEIILGLNIASENQVKLIDIANAKNIPCYKMIKANSSFQFRFERIN